MKDSKVQNEETLELFLVSNSIMWFSWIITDLSGGGGMVGPVGAACGVGVGSMSRGGSVCWFCVLVLCVGSVCWFCESGWFRVLVLYFGAVCWFCESGWFCMLVLCVGSESVLSRFCPCCCIPLLVKCSRINYTARCFQLAGADQCQPRSRRDPRLARVHTDAGRKDDWIMKSIRRTRALLMKLCGFIS